jgi:DNA-binding transcriptional LysR family regulator
MRQVLPPLTTLEGFDAAARLGSFVAAADELGLTQSAISHQIRSLERALDQALFHRVHRQVVLTDAGREFHRTVRDMLRQLRQGVDRLAPYRKPNSVIVYCDNALFQGWLLPRLPALLSETPGVDPWIDSRGHAIDLATTEFDLFLTMDDPDEDSGFPEELLFTLDYRPYAAPALAERLADRIAVPGPDPFPLLHVEGRVDWAGWFGDPAARGAAWHAAGPFFTDAVSALAAAAQGLGVVLAPTLLAEPMVAAGGVAPLGSRVWRDAARYRMVVNCQPDDARWVMPVVDWLRREAAQVRSSV